jgi:hypothetical protein
MVAFLRRRVSLRIIKLYLSSNKFGDCKQDILSFFYKGKKNSSCFVCLNNQWIICSYFITIKLNVKLVFGVRIVAKY